MILILLTLFILGTAIGSFLNVVIDRSVRGESILGRSYCDFCRAKLKTLDLIPILSFVALGARCRYCHRSLTMQYPLVETASGILFVLAYLVPVTGGNYSLIVLAHALFLISVFIVVAVVDFKFQLIPTALVYFAALVTLFYNFFMLGSADFVRSVVSAFVVALGFLIIVLVTRGRGMGTGDIPLAFLIGLMLGWPKVLVGIFLAFLAGSLVAIVLIILGRKRFGQTIPFGPFLVGGAIAAFFWGEQIVSWYLSRLL